MERDFRLCLVAKMYYIDQMQQKEIAQVFDMSPMMVSRILERAKKEGIVTFHVKTMDMIDWESGAKLKAKYPGLKQAIVVTVRDGEDSRERVGAAAANYVQELLMDDSILGVSWGRTIMEFVSALHATECKNVRVVQMSGGFLNESNYDMMPSNLIRNASEKLGAVPMFLNAPMFVDSARIRDSLMNDHSIRYVVDLFKNMSIAVYGISDLERKTTMKQVGILTEDEVTELRGKGAVGDVMGYFVDKSGGIVEWSKTPCYMGASLENAYAATHAVCLATGADKARILTLAIQKKYLNTIVISDDLAKELLEEF